MSARIGTSRLQQNLILGLNSSSPVFLPLNGVLYVHRREAVTIRLIGVRCNGRADDTFMTKTLLYSPSALNPERQGKDASGARHPMVALLASPLDTSTPSLHTLPFPFSCRPPLKYPSNSYVLGSLV
jgi:hypothetical protein